MIETKGTEYDIDSIVDAIIIIIKILEYHGWGDKKEKDLHRLKKIVDKL